RVTATELFFIGTSESSSRGAIRGEGCHWGKELPQWTSTRRLQAADSSTNAAGFQCPARASIDVGRAFVVAYAERQSAAPGHVATQLEAAESIVGPLGNASSILLAMPIWELVDARQNEDVLPVEVHQSMMWLDGEIILIKIHRL